jgi:hypothetical protein
VFGNFQARQFLRLAHLASRTSLSLFASSSWSFWFTGTTVHRYGFRKAVNFYKHAVFRPLS